MPYDLGIDLGTTFTCAAIMRDGRVEVCQLGASSALVPSVVSVRDDGSALIGDPAERRVVSDPTRTVREFKRRIGDDSPYLIGGTPYTADRLASLVLADIVTQVTEQEGASPRRVALTHPADYGAHKLERWRAAASAAGIAEPLLIPEPVAAALAYTERASVPVGAHLLVYDFGGGTFDAALVRRDRDGPTLVGIDGLERLGGVDLDADVFDHIDRALEGQVGALDSNHPATRATIARLRDEARAAKEALSADTDTDIPVLLTGAPATVRLTRAEFEVMADRSIAATLPVIDRVVQSAGLDWPDVHAVLLVGGTSRIPIVAERVRSHTGRQVVTDLDPKAAVAIGAAMLAARAGGAAPPEAPEPGAQGPGAPEPGAHGAATTEQHVVATGAAAIGAPAIASAASAEPTTLVAAVNNDSDLTRNRRRNLLVATLGALLLIGGGGGAFALFGGDGDASPPRSTAAVSTVAEPSSSTSSSTSTSTSTTTSTTVPTTSPETRPTDPPTATTVPTPTVTNVDAPESLLCDEARANGNQVEVRWETTNAASVSVSIDGPGPFETGLPPNGSLMIPASCDDIQTVIVTPFDSDGDAGTTQTVTITIGADPLTTSTLYTPLP
jgi:actin-like ATPase involved in cell morphogenesis